MIHNTGNTLLKKQGKKYTALDYIRIPFQTAPRLAGLRLTNRIISSAIPSIQVLVTAQFIDTALAVFRDETTALKIWVPLFLLIILILYQHLNWSLVSFLDIKMEQAMARRLRSEMVQKRASLEYCHIENSETWDLVSRTCSDPVGRILGGFNNLQGIADLVIRVFSLLAILFTAAWWVSLIVIGLSVPLMFLSFKGGKSTYQAHKEADKHSRRAGYYHGILSGREACHERAIFNYTDPLNVIWRDLYENARKLNLAVSLKNFIRMKGSSLITALLSVLIIGVLLIPLSDGSLSTGLFMSMTTAVLSLIQMMSWQLSGLTQQFANNREYLKDLTKFGSLSETAGVLALPDFERQLKFESIEFREVSFCYPGTTQYVLKHFTLYIQDGLHYAFVGVNGAGKTTIAKLLTGMYDQFEGEILIDGRSILLFSPAELKGLFSVVYQDFAAYSLSLRENIALGNIHGVNESKITEAISKIQLNSALHKLPLGLDTPLGKIDENGVDLSGGEWQRVVIARSLCSLAPIRILDEPTASLDPVAERAVYEMFEEVSKSKTAILITHRLGAARLADVIVVLDNGAVAEQGTHDVLMNRKGIYAEMFESQRSWYE